MRAQVKQAISSFIQQFPMAKYPKGTVISRTQTPAKYFFYLQAGCIKMTSTSSQGKNLVLHIFYPGSFFPLLPLITKKNYVYDCSALTDVALYAIPARKFTTFLQTNPEVVYDLQRRLLQEVWGLLYRLEQSTFLDAYGQVAGMLLYFARHFSEKSLTSAQNIINLRITHQEIAHWLGLTRENVSMQMKRLEREGLIRKEGGLLVITNQDRLQELADPHATP